MTLPLNSRLSALYDTNGTQKDFSFGFRVFFDPDNGGYGLEVRRQTVDGYEVIPKSDYLVLPVEDNSAGVVRFSVAPSTGQQIYIAGKTPTIQQLVLTNFGRYSAESIETQFDFITAIIQEWLSALDEETRQRISNDEITREYANEKFLEVQSWVYDQFPDYARSAFDEIFEGFYSQWVDALNELNKENLQAENVFDGNENQHQINNSLIRIVSNKTELLTINNPRNKQVVYVTENEKRYIYNINLTDDDNGVTVIGKWEMEIQEAYYASWFCADSSPSAPKQDEFMVGYIYATSKKRPFIVDIPIYVNSTRKQSGFYNQVHYAVVAQSNSVLWFTPEGKLIQIGVNEAAYSILSLYGADNFLIKNPKLEGDKYTKTGNVGESGFGLAITGCSNGIIEYPHISKCRGDSIYLGQEYYNNNAATLVSKNIKVIKPTLLDSYRNGLTLSAGEDIYFDAPFINIAQGTAPEACIDIEPEEGLANKSYLKNVIIHNATLLRGNSSGVLHWISGSRDVDVKFTGTTTISGCYYTLGCNGASANWADVNCTGGVWYEKVVLDHRLTASTEGVFDVSTPTRGKGVPITIDNLEIHTDAKVAGVGIGFLFDGRYTYSGNFKVKQLSIADHGFPTYINAIRSQAGNVVLENVKIPIPDHMVLAHYDGVGTYSCGDYVDIGGYEERTVANINTDSLLANTQLFTPMDDGTGAVYTRVQTLPNIGRKLTYKLNDNAVSVGYGLQVMTPFLELSRIECIDKGGYVTIDNTQAQPQVSRIFRKWGLSGVYVNQ